MPTSGYNFTAQEITVRFRTPYISETLNKQFRGIVSAGVYEGFNPKTSLSPLHILLAVDPSGRSSALAVSDLDPTISVGVHLVADVDLDLSAYFSKTVAVCIDLSYAFPSDTTGVINVYDLGTETVPATSCILARVLVPAAGLIPAANISLNGRSFPFLSRGRDATPLVSVVRNGAPYLTASLSVTPDFWENTALVGMSYIASNAVLAPSGFDLTFRARKTAAGVGSITGRLTQKIGLPIPANRRLRLTGAFRPTVVPSIGNPTLIATITDAAGVAITLVTVPLVSAIVGVWQTFSTTVQLPAVTSTPAVLKELSINCSAVTFTTVGANATVFDVADVDLQLEQNGPATDALPEISGESHFTKTRHYADAYPGAAYSEITFDGAETLLTSTLPTLSHTFHVNGNLTVDGSTTLGTIFANTLDTPAPVDATSLTIGGTNALSVLIGRALRNTEVRGVLLVGTATNPDSAQLHVLGNETISGTHLRVRSGVGLPFNLTSVTGTGFTYTGGLHSFIGALSQSGGGFTLQGGASASGLSTTTGNIFIQASLGGNVSVSAGNVGTAQLRTTGTGDATVIAVGTANAVMQTTGGGDCIIHNTNLLAGGVSLFSGGTAPAPANGTLLIGARDDIGITTAGATGLIQIAAAAPAGAVVISAGDEVNATAKRVRIGSPLVGGGVVLFAGGAIPAFSPGDVLIGNELASGGVSIFAGGTPPVPGTNDLHLGAVGDVKIEAVGDVKIESTSNGIDITAASNIVVQSSASGITVVSATSINLTSDGGVTIFTGSPGDVINLDGIVKTVRTAGGAAFDISAVTVKRISSISVSDGSTSSLGTISLVKGVYEFKAMLFYDCAGANAEFDLIVDPATGNVEGSVVDSSAVGSGSLLTKIDIFAATASKTFTNGQSTNNADGAHWVEGTLTFDSDTVVTCRAQNIGADPGILQKGSYFRFFLIHLT